MKPGYDTNRFSLKGVSANLGHCTIKNLEMLLRCLKTAKLPPDLDSNVFCVKVGDFKGFKSLYKTISSSNASTKMIGVSHLKDSQKWKARITKNGKRVCGWNCKRAKALSSPADSSAIFLLV